MIYNIFCKLYSIGVHIAALWNPKAAMWIKGRKGWAQKLSQSINNQKSKNSGKPTIWMHCASLGEFEQGRPVLEAIRSALPDANIVLSFFSPSGYEIRKNYTGANLVCYLPMDGRKNAVDFLDLVQPDLVCWVKYEYWYHYLTQVKKRNIPLLMVSGIYRKEQPFFQWYGRLHRYILESFQHFFVQNEDSAQLLRSIRVPAQKITVNGDTRFDRVAAIAAQSADLPLVEAFCANNQIIVAGSTWEADEEILSHFVNVHPHVKCIIAPHEIDESHLEDIENIFSNSVRFSLYRQEPQKYPETGTLIIDNIGMLSTLYKYATITYVGGGFNKSGIHNILEAAVYGKPVIFGPVYEKFAEARDLTAAEAAFPVQTALELESTLQELLERQDFYMQAAATAREYVAQKTGATRQIIDYIKQNDVLPTGKTVV